ncbi:hypothetical protein, partial [Streptomyces sp. cmx-18-6]|uniref:TubC N-terminal docking domain-related protein n=1 Tax=Streptomyces sp. cmx-18-6 TaxID=2790930 RepID=UPI0039812A8D
MVLHEAERPGGAAFSFADRLLEELRRRRIRLWADGERLHYDAPANTIDDRTLELLRRHRDILIQRLRQTAGAAVARPGGHDSRWLRPLKLNPHGTGTVVF